LSFFTAASQTHTPFPHVRPSPQIPILVMPARHFYVGEI